MGKKKSLGDITPTICEAAYNEYSKLDDSMTELIHKNRIEVRDFIILSFVCDQDELSIVQITQILNIGLEETRDCANRLNTAGLVEYDDNQSDAGCPIRCTPAGHLVALRIHGRKE